MRANRAIARILHDGSRGLRYIFASGQLEEVVRITEHRCHACPSRTSPLGIAGSAYAQLVGMVMDVSDGLGKVFVGIVRTVDERKGIVPKFGQFEGMGKAVVHGSDVCERTTENFWNGWCNRRTDIVLIATGSATSWMADKIEGNQGGLHARVTCNLHLSPFNLHETEEYLRQRNCQWDRYQILQCYMIFGGVPFYLSLLNTADSLAQNIDRLFFSEGAQLKMEFDELYNALFTNADTYVSVVRLLSENKSGMTREDIVKTTGLEGAFLSKILKNLERCDFITRLSQYGSKVRNNIFRLTDFYTLFYYKFIESNNTKDDRWWSNNMGAPSVSAWMGLSFELVCLGHHKQIKGALGIAGVGTSISTWRSKADTEKGIPGFQIDMIIERADRIIHLCEMKFSTDQYGITDSYEMKLRERMGLFRMATKNKKSLVITFVTTYGVVGGKHKSIVHSEVTMDDLFQA